MKLVADTKQIAQQIIGCFFAGGKLFLAGNGGSAAMAQHWAAEFVCKFEYDRIALPAIALTTDTSIITAISNDYDYTQVFARQIQALGEPGDILLLLSTSNPKDLNIKHNHSYNLEMAKQAALEQGMEVIWLPREGKSTAKIQEYQFKLMHDICRRVEEAFI